MRMRICGLICAAVVIFGFATSVNAEFFKLIAPNVGWTIEGRNQLLWTNDGGRNWKNIKLPAPDNSTISGICFVDPNQGWALISHGEPAVPHGLNFTVAFTQDAGATWSTQPLRM